MQGCGLRERREGRGVEHGAVDTDQNGHANAKHHAQHIIKKVNCLRRLVDLEPCRDFGSFWVYDQQSLKPRIFPRQRIGFKKVNSSANYWLILPELSRQHVEGIDMKISFTGMPRRERKMRLWTELFGEHDKNRNPPPKN